jgi:hypothetical protein
VLAQVRQPDARRALGRQGVTVAEHASDHIHVSVHDLTMQVYSAVVMQLRKTPAIQAAIDAQTQEERAAAAINLHSAIYNAVRAGLGQ